MSDYVDKLRLVAQNHQEEIFASVEVSSAEAAAASEAGTSGTQTHVQGLDQVVADSMAARDEAVGQLADTVDWLRSLGYWWL